MLFGFGMILFIIGLVLLIIRITTVLMKIVYSFGCFGINQLILKPILMRNEKFREYEEEKKLQAKIEETEKARIKNELLNKKQDDIAYALSSKLQEMEDRYPLANRELFDKYRSSFMKVTMNELESIEKDIEISHYNNKKQRQIELGLIPVKKYDEHSLKNIPIVHSQERFIDNHKIFLNVHKDENTYIVYINVPDIHLNRIYATNNFTIAKRVQNSLATRCGLASFKNLTIHDVLDENVVNEIIANAVQEA
jgi:hypothetical protein